MGKHYDINFKEKVVNEYKKGTFGGKILTARHFGITESTLTHWIVKDRKQGNQINDIGYEILKKYQAFLKAQRERK